MENKVYIIILWRDGIPFFLQDKNKVAWCFEHVVKPYIKLGSAINAAKKLSIEYQYDKIRIYHIPRSMTFNSCDFARGKFDKDMVHEIRK
jgi:hypothetical protein